MKFLKIAGIALVILLLIIAVLGVYIGLFSSMKVVEKESEAYLVAGKEFTGPYNLVGATMTEVDNQLRTMGLKCTRGFGIYYDNPQTTPAEKCRSFVGDVIEATDAQRIEEIKAKGFKVDSIPKAPALIIEFATRSTLSFVVGPIKAYPALNKYVEEKKYKSTQVFEIYDVPNKKTLYVMHYTK